MASKDRVGHNTRCKPTHTRAEKRLERREEIQARKSGKRKRRAGTARTAHA